MVNFACLSCGQTSTGNNQGTASLYSYFASTAIILLPVLRLPPDGPADWLGRGANAPASDPTVRGGAHVP